MPVLLIAGERDTKFVALATRMAESIGSHADLKIIANCGHSPHLEQPEQFLEVTKRFLKP